MEDGLISARPMYRSATDSMTNPHWGDTPGPRSYGTVEGFVSARDKILGVNGNALDITARKQAEQLLQKENRVLATIRDCHEAILRAEAELALLRELCRIIVCSGKEQMAWVGYAEDNTYKSVRQMAAAGNHKNFLAKARITWDDKPRGRGPVGTAIRTGKVCVCQNTQTDPDFAPFRRAARRAGFGSVIALPLIVENRCLGVLCIYAHASEAFDAAEQLLLADLASDCALGITTLRLRAERTRLEVAMLKSIERERERIGRDLHDGLGQLLTGMKYRCGYLSRIPNTQWSEVKKEAKEMEFILNKAIEQARGMVRGLRSLEVKKINLAPALKKLAEDFQAAGGTRCVCKLKGPFKIPDDFTANHLYRIAQEALHNAFQHSGAAKTTLALEPWHKGVVLSVTDDGVGFPVELKESGMGLNNMRMRARIIGGQLEISRRNSCGTTVTCKCPSKAKAKHEYFKKEQTSAC